MHELIGQTLGQYEIVEKLGEGSMGVVFKARQPDLERWVAIKALLPQYAAAPGFRERFLREARAIAQLEHPNILPVYDFGQQSEYTYLVMRCVESARTLSDIMHQSLSFRQITDYLDQIAAALDYAHRRGIIHRDVKPGNILLNNDDWIFLADFGLARMVESTSHLTGTGMSVGTPAYMSPEQGAGRELDARADVYALGVIAYQMLTGQIPHYSDTPYAIIYKRNTEPPPPLRESNPDIPTTVEQCVQTALAPNPDERYRSAGAFMASLRQAVDEAQAGNLMSITLPLPQEAVPESLLSPVSARFCGHCGTKIESGMRFCGHCGAAVSTPAPAMRQSPPVASRRVAGSRRANFKPGFWSIAAVLGVVLFVAGVAFGVIEVIAVAVAIVLVVGGIYLYQYYEDWFG